MAREADGQGLIPKLFKLGATTSSYGITLVPGQVATMIKLISGGTLELVNGSTPSPVGLGFPFTVANETISMDMVGTFYVAVSGATCVFAVNTMRSQGFGDTVTQTGT